MIKTCTCEHSSQDKLHGKNQRVHNEVTKKKSANNKTLYRCTVCLKERE